MGRRRQVAYYRDGSSLQLADNGRRVAAKCPTKGRVGE